MLKVIALVGLSLFLGLLAMPAEAAGTKIFIQWAKQNPQDWELKLTGDWTKLPSKNDPVNDTSVDGIHGTGESQLTGAPGWIFALNVQGVEFAWFDHYHVVEGLVGGDNAITVTAWRDDPNLWPEGMKEATVVQFFNPTFDQKVGQVNTRQVFIIYAQPNSPWWGRGLPNVLPWTDFVPPTVDVFHGIYVSDAKWDEHLAARTLHGWREWTQ